MATYHSLFDDVSVEDLAKHQPYHGTLITALEHLSQPYLSCVDLIQYPARILQAIIDYKIDTPEEHIESILICALKTVLKIYKTRIVDLSALEVLCHQNTNLLKSPIDREADTATSYSSWGKLSQQTAHRILNRTHGKDIFIIPMAHGATHSALDILLRYEDLTGSTHSRIYPCRFSKYKQEDAKPQLTTDELDYIKEIAQDREIIMYEDNIITGKTINLVMDYFQTIFPNRYIMQQSNVDLRTIRQSDTEDHNVLLHRFIEQFEEDIIS